MFQGIDLVQTALLNVHVISVISWVGAMYFNLTLLFPMYKSRGATVYAELMQEQASRAVWLLYLLVGLTLLSGLGLTALKSGYYSAEWLGLKMSLWMVMLIAHLYGSFVIWPRVFLAIDTEMGRLFLNYKLSMLLSGTAGTAAIIVSLLVS